MSFLSFGNAILNSSGRQCNDFAPAVFWNPIDDGLGASLLLVLWFLAFFSVLKGGFDEGIIPALSLCAFIHSKLLGLL